MEVWLKDNGSMFRFPVIPMPIGKDGGASVDTVGIVQKGKVAIYNGTEPDSIKLDSFFPKHEYGFCNYKGFPSPEECATMLETWKNKGTRLRFIVTGTPINISVLITSFSYHYKDGTGNLHYNLTLMQKKDISIEEWSPPSADPLANVTNYKREVAKYRTIKGTHKVKSGDYLYSIAKKYYGNGDSYKLITHYPDNVAKYPSLKNSNVIKSGWELVIP